MNGMQTRIDCQKSASNTLVVDLALYKITLHYITFDTLFSFLSSSQFSNISIPRPLTLSFQLNPLLFILFVSNCSRFLILFLCPLFYLQYYFMSYSLILSYSLIHSFIYFFIIQVWRSPSCFQWWTGVH